MFLLLLRGRVGQRTTGRCSDMARPLLTARVLRDAGGGAGGAGTVGEM